jgi:hypothetical protein
MLRSLKPLCQYTILASDGPIGVAHDFYFEDDTWIVRYMIAKTGHWLTGRPVLLAPSALGKADWSAHTFAVALTREQIRLSPSIDTDKPVSRQQEIQLHDHFGWPHYWAESPLAAPPPLPEGNSAPKPATDAKSDPHLRSVREVTGYRVRANDGDLGHVNDFIADDTAWTIRYLVVDLAAWMPSRKVLISPEWLREINFAQRGVAVSMTKASVAKCPEFHPTDAVNREYEERLYDYYGRPVYWAERVSRK